MTETSVNVYFCNVKIVIMKSFLMIGIELLVSAAVLLTSCGHNETQSTEMFPNAVKDIDGNEYDAVRIGKQVWMAENLRTTRYSDGTEIPLGSSYYYFSTPLRYAPGDGMSDEENMDNVPRYGYLYNWTAVTRGNSSCANPSGVQGVCPKGWHVPSDAEWKELTNYMKTQSDFCSGGVGKLAKALSATWGWYESDTRYSPGNDPNTNNATGFSALPAGDYFAGHGCEDFGCSALFWSATEEGGSSAYDRCIDYDYANVDKGEPDKSFGLSVRCVRDK